VQGHVCRRSGSAASTPLWFIIASRDSQHELGRMLISAAICYIYPRMASSRILISGASGLIGTALLPSLSAAGYDPALLVRGATSNRTHIRWAPAESIDANAVSGFDAVIHLAGESIAGRWTRAKKARIHNSRILGTTHLSEALAHAPQPPRVLVCASAIGYYGDRGEEILREDSPPGQGFLPSVCRDWERASESASKAGIRTVNMRLGIVLSARGGALAKMLFPFRLGLGGNMGNGRQWWSWIHIDDIVGAIHHILKADSLQGPVNLVSANPVRNAEFTRILAGVLSRPAVFPMPSFMAKLAFGQMGEELLLASQRVEPAKLIASGYSFRYSDLQKSLTSLLRK
jgi:uncharacterized protein (TIGR01777 family)